MNKYRSFFLLYYSVRLHKASLPSKSFLSLQNKPAQHRFIPKFILSIVLSAAEIFQKNMYNMISIIVSVCASIISGMVLFFLQRFFKKKQKVDEERDRAKAKENMLILKSIDAVGKLTYADAVAIRDGKTNGEMKEAMKAYAEVKDDTGKVVRSSAVSVNIK